jgi:hypothetical protein
MADALKELAERSETRRLHLIGPKIKTSDLRIHTLKRGSQPHILCFQGLDHDLRVCQLSGETVARLNWQSG